MQPVTQPRPLWMPMALILHRAVAPKSSYSNKIFTVKLHRSVSVLFFFFKNNAALFWLISQRFCASALKTVFTIAMVIFQLDWWLGHSPSYRVT